MSVRHKISADLGAHAIMAHETACRGLLFDDTVPKFALLNTLINLRHWADREKLDFNKINEEAQSQYAHELFHS